MLKKYFQNLYNTSKSGDAREESYYPDLKNLLESYGDYCGKKYSVTIIPRPTEGGNPDFRIWDGRQKIVGYIEAKLPSEENLDHIENTEQLKRYRETFPNMVLTNFFEFRLYRNGQMIKKISVGRPFVMHQLRVVPPVEMQEEFIQLLEQFFAFSTPKTTSAKRLAIELAKRTRFLRDNVISEELKEEKIQGTQNLEGFYKAFKNHLIASLTVQDFSDLFAQTITYGLFAARSRADETFNRKLAYEFIPPTIGILRDVFRLISSSDLPASMEWIIDDIAEILNETNLKKIISDFYREGKGSDPIVYFYETFLTEYDPKTREKRGIYYTPEPVVNFIVRSVHKLLKTKFNKPDGLADLSVTVLDPAAGTLTFPVEAISVAIHEFIQNYGEGGIKDFIKDHILKNFYAFEIMMAPYAIGHLKIGFILNEFGFELAKEDRFRLYLTNTLEFSKKDPNNIPGIFEKSIAQESLNAIEIKEKIPVFVIFGNPPYSVSSMNTVKSGTDFHKQYERYKESVRKEERNIQPLSADYIKFIAFAHWKIKQNPNGIVGIITNNSYLDGLIHRDIRKEIMNDFGEIFILNLHGNINTKEKTPGGLVDENVFDIQQGVSILLLVRSEKISNTRKIKYYDLWGSRDEKYKILEKYDVSTIKWQELSPFGKYCFFVPKNFDEDKKYSNFLSLKDIFTQYYAGVATGKDKIFVDFDKSSLSRKFPINDKGLFTIYLKENNIEENLIEKWFEELSNTVIEDQILPYAYRPFDDRYVLYNPKVLQRARDVIMKHMLHENISLLCMRQYIYSAPYSHAFVTRYISDRRIFISNRGAAHVFPLFLIEQNEQLDLYDSAENSSTHVNFNQPFIQKIKSQYRIDIDPKNIFSYIYSILYSNIYREKYLEFVKIDFPKIPFPQDYNLFNEIGSLGKELQHLHLIDKSSNSSLITKFRGNGSSVIQKVLYDEKNYQIKINQEQYFENIEPLLWNYFIGGYRVLEKWLKEREGKVLSLNDIKYYSKVITSLSKTIEIQKEIDKIYPDVEKDLIHFDF